jgi:three-Cys-motif partner protein
VMEEQVLPKLKEVSKAKHRILEKYFPAWAQILGSRNLNLVYVDCFAGFGQYAQGEEGSPLLIIRRAQEVVEKANGRFSIHAIFVEKDAQAARALQSHIPGDLPVHMNVHVLNEDAHDFVPKLLGALPNGMPAFFFVDPYGHPLTIPVMNQILSRPRTEILLTLMWYAINMHLNNLQTEAAITRMFGGEQWKSQSFMKMSGSEREKDFVQYFLSQLNAKYKLSFRVRFGQEDKVPAGERRTKYYLIHLSNHPKAVLLMKEVMWPLGDEMGTFDYSATLQQRLFSQTPTLEKLIDYLRQHCSGKTLTFEQLREETWDSPFIEKHYREAVKKLEKCGEVRVVRCESKKSGVSGRDRISFLGGNRHGGLDEN